MENLVKVTLFGDLGENIGKQWEFAATSVGECIHGIENITKRLYKYLIEMDKKGAKYRVIINGEDFICDKKGVLGINDFETIKNSGLSMQYNNLKTIDIVPILEGNDSKILGILTTIAGVILIVIGALLGWTGIGGVLIIAGLGLIAAGVMTLLARPPRFAPFQQAPNGQISYLFNGPTNTTQEGGPVPIGYGRLLVGSQVISASYVIQDYNVVDKNIVKLPSASKKRNNRRDSSANPQFAILYVEYLAYLAVNNDKTAKNFSYDTWYHDVYLGSLKDNFQTKIGLLTTSYNALQSGYNPGNIIVMGTDTNVNTIQ